MMKEALLIFVKNIIPGHVKTRLAKTIGKNEAINIYKQLLQITHKAAKRMEVDKIVFYSDYKEKDLWDEPEFKKQIQQGADLGQRMKHALDFAFENDYKKVVLIGTDCPLLSREILQSAFENVDEFDIVIGPATDGGYYLIGMKKKYHELFENISWSTNEVLNKTLSVCKQYQLSFFLLPILPDVDEEKDLIHLKKINVSQEI